MSKLEETRTFTRKWHTTSWRKAWLKVYGDDDQAHQRLGFTRRQTLAAGQAAYYKYREGIPWPNVEARNAARIFARAAGQQWPPSGGKERWQSDITRASDTA